MIFFDFIDNVINKVLNLFIHYYYFYYYLFNSYNELKIK